MRIAAPTASKKAIFGIESVSPLVDGSGQGAEACRRRSSRDLRRKGGRFDHLFVRRRKRAPATTSTAIPATKTQSPHQRSRFTRPTTMRIAETTASRVKNG